jgi:hypothetical protein
MSDIKALLNGTPERLEFAPDLTVWTILIAAGSGTLSGGEEWREAAASCSDPVIVPFNPPINPGDPCQCDICTLLRHGG